jgi:ribosomal L7/L12-like protein
MNEPFLLGLLISALIALAIVVRVRPRNDGRTLSRLEAKVDALLAHEGIRFDPYAEAPPRVIDALHRGQKIEAIKEYRAATGAGLKEAKEYVEELQRRAAPRV